MPRREEEYGTIKATVQNISQQISALSGGINRIEANTSEGKKTIWENGNKNPQIIVGTSWELHVSFTVSSTVSYWGIAVTEVATLVPTSYQKQGLLDTYISATVVTKTLAFNMGAMPAGTVNLRVKLWITDTYIGITLPPASNW